jgi:hypothetical protein
MLWDFVIYPELNLCVSYESLQMAVIESAVWVNRLISKAHIFKGEMRTGYLLLLFWRANSIVDMAIRQSPGQPVFDIHQLTQGLRLFSV